MLRIIIPAMLFLFSSSFAQNNARLVELKLEMRNSHIIQAGDDGSAKPIFMKKKVGLGILYSLLLPGMGELYGGDYSTGKYFTIIEAASWITYFGLDYYHRNEKQNYEDFAVLKAGVSTTGKDDSYWANIGVYMNIDQYNNTMDLQWQFDKVYDRDAFYWKWKSNSERATYRDMWLASEHAKTALNYVAGVMVLNRIVSAINAVRIIKRHNRGVSAASSFGINFGVESFAGIPEGVKINFFKSF
jgi:hypothetical protein